MERIFKTISLRQTWLLTGLAFLVNVLAIWVLWYRRPTQTFLLMTGFPVAVCLIFVLCQLFNKNKIGSTVSLGAMDLSDYSTLEIILAFLAAVTSLTTSLIFGVMMILFMFTRRLVSYHASQKQAVWSTSGLLMANLLWIADCAFT